eukprot:TRINITY_DN30705_c0_g1_i1.p1 TRINITY_DN30705_c0_g1~~TRINITY_DN30705_c0_g1_i1.p1  ORF type:complete len:651 (+),score=93.86 TRINITY_DN30705_c0_g1_i1:78-2030(+)
MLEKETFIHNIKTSFVPSAVENLYSEDEEPIGCEEEIQVVVGQILKQHATPPFLTLHGPPGGGKSAVVRAALKRIVKMVLPRADRKAECPICLRHLWECNSEYAVIKVVDPASANEGIRAVESHFQLHQLDTEEVEDPKGAVDRRRQLSRTLRNSSKRVVIWLSSLQVSNLKALESYLYMMTDILHSDEIIRKVTVLIETHDRLRDVDARIVSRLSTHVLPIRSFSPKSVSLFVSNRLSFVSPGITVFGSQVGRFSDHYSDFICPDDVTLICGEVAYMKLKMSSELIIVSVLVVDSKGNPHYVDLGEKVDTSAASDNGQGRKLPLTTLKRVMWPPKGRTITRVRLYSSTAVLQDLIGVRLGTQRIKEPQDKPQPRRAYCSSWNSIVAKLCQTPLFINSLMRLGDFSSINHLLCTWLSRLSVLLSDNSSLVWPKHKNIHSQVDALSRIFAFHFSATHRFGMEPVPKDISLAALQTDYVVDKASVSTILNKAGNYLVLKGCSGVVHGGLRELTNSQQVLLLLLVVQSDEVEEQLLKSGKLVPHNSVEVVPSRSATSYVRILKSSVVGKQPPIDFSFLFELDLQQLVTARLLVSATCTQQQQRKPTESKYLLNIEKVDLIHYLRCQRDAGSDSVCSEEVFSILNLDQNLNLID